MKPLEMGAFEAKNRLSKLLTMVEKGQRVFITRRGRRVALLTRADDDLGGRDAERGGDQDLVHRFRTFRAGARPGPESLRELIEEGRR